MISISRAALLCTALAPDELGKLPEYRATATAYHRGRVRQALPGNPPSRGVVDDMQAQLIDERECFRIRRPESSDDDSRCVDVLPGAAGAAERAEIDHGAAGAGAVSGSGRR